MHVAPISKHCHLMVIPLKFVNFSDTEKGKRMKTTMFLKQLMVKFDKMAVSVYKV